MGVLDRDMTVYPSMSTKLNCLSDHIDQLNYCNSDNVNYNIPAYLTISTKLRPLVWCDNVDNARPVYLSMIHRHDIALTARLHDKALTIVR